MEKPQYIYHICTEKEWEVEAQHDNYSHKSLVSEGFIHCSTEEQIQGVLSRYFIGVKNLVCLKIEIRKLNSKLLFEKSTNDELFPHVYGSINKDSIISFEKLL